MLYFGSDLGSGLESSSLDPVDLESRRKTFQNVSQFGCESHQKSRRMTLSGILRQFLSQTLEQQHVWCSLPDGTGEFWNKRWQGAYERFIYSDNLSFLLRPSRTAQSTKGGVELKETDGPRSPRPASHAVLRPRMPEANVSSPDAVLAT